MKEYQVKMFRVENKKAIYFTTIISCDDPATEIWLNPYLGGIPLEVKQI